MSIVSAAWIAFYIYGKFPVYYRFRDTDYGAYTERCIEVHYVPLALPIPKDHWVKYPWYERGCFRKDKP